MYRSLVLMSFYCVLAGCGGGGGNGSAATPADNDPPPAQASTQGIEGGGFISRFAADTTSLSVGGKQLDLSDPALMVTVDGQAAAVSDLRVGDQIFFQGTTSDGGATIRVTSIEQDDLLEGPVDAGSIDLAAGRFSVLGQVVVVGSLTVFDSDIQPNDLSGLAEGDFVEITGVVNADGNIDASRIEREDSDDDFEVTGVIGAVDTAAQTFTINGLTVDYSAAVLEDFDGAEPAVGDRVEVEGNALVGGVLVASEVEREDTGYDGDEGDLASLEGTVTEVVDSQQFAVNGRAVAVDAQTRYEDGSANDVAVGVAVEVSGRLDANGVLLATEVDFDDERQDSRYEVKALVEAVDTGTDQLTLLGIVVQIDGATRLQGADNAPLAVADIRVGDALEVDGIPDPAAPQRLLATKIELEDDAEEAELTAPIDALNEPELTVFGVRVITDGATEFEGADDDLDATGFFAEAVAGAFVEVEGLWDGVTLLAEELSLEDD